MTKIRKTLALQCGLLLCWAGLTSAGPVFISGDDADDSGHCQGTACGGLYPQALNSLYTQSTSPGTGILAIGVNGGNAQFAIDSWNTPANGGPGAPLTIVTTTVDIAAVNFSLYKVLYVPSNAFNTNGGITESQIAALNARQADIQTFVNTVGGGLMALTEGGSTGAFGWLPLPLTFSFIDLVDVYPTSNLLTELPGVGATDTNMDHCCYHNIWTGPLTPNPYLGLKVLARTREAQTLDENGAQVDAPVILGGGIGTRISAENCSNGIDDDGDGLTDNADPDCQVCGDGDLDPGETCDDGNTVDGDGCAAVCLLENESPNCTAAAASVSTLWPPNHKGVPINVVGVSDPDGDSVSITVDSIFQDEPVRETGSGSGNTCPDATGVGTDTALVRAERAGNPKVPGNGRVYHIGFTAEDEQGGTCTGVVKVCVPHDQGQGAFCIDDGLLFDSTVCP